MRKCACGLHLKEVVCFQHVHEIEIIDTHNSLSDSCILCSRNMLALIGMFDRNRTPTAKLVRHYLQNGSDKQKQSVNV